ncbi:MAG: hypothetical protein AAGC68_16200, partial [Verrucomicrobiota bacterium]
MKRLRDWLGKIFAGEFVTLLLAAPLIKWLLFHGANLVSVLLAALTGLWAANSVAPEIRSIPAPLWRVAVEERQLPEGVHKVEHAEVPLTGGKQIEVQVVFHTQTLSWQPGFPQPSHTVEQSRFDQEAKKHFQAVGRAHGDWTYHHVVALG